jgi:alpha-N-arabinofuranosidase
MTACALALAALSSSLFAREIAVAVKPDAVVNTVNPLVYGHFFEHIYHSANNGIWGEVVWNRSFEQNRENLMGSPGWFREGDVVSYTGDEPQSRIFGANQYRDFDYTVEVRKAPGDGAIRVFFRGNSALTLGAQNNTVHTLESTAAGGRGGRGGSPPGASTFAAPVQGSLNADQWYKVRVRMEGQHLEAWLDDKKLFDVQAPAPGARGGRGGGGPTATAPAVNIPAGVQPGATDQAAGNTGPATQAQGAGSGRGQGGGGGTVAASGWIGVGTVNAKAQFRNFLVKGIDGTVLWNHPLPANVPNSVVERWGVTGGTARVISAPGQALNDARCLELAGAGQTVLSQPDFFLRANDPLEGSLWLKGRAPGGATVQFVDGTTVIAEQKLDAPAGEWKEFPLRFVSPKEVNAATLQIIFNGDHQVMIDQVSLMPKSAKDNGGFRPDLFEAFKGLQPTAMRWPGGCYAETYRWKHGIGPQKDRKKGLQAWWEEYDPNALGTDEYIRLSRMLNSEPLLVIQTGLHQVKPGGSRQDGDPIDTPEEWEPYIVEACEWIEYCNGPATSTWGAVRAANGHPEPYNVKLWEIDNELWRSRVTSPARYSEAVNLFAKRMKEKDPSITIIAHGGNGTDRNYNIPVVNNAAENFSVLSIHHYTNADQFITGINAQDRLYTDVTNLIKGSRNPRIKIYVSEWNAQTTDWRTGVYAGGILNVFEKHGAYVTMGGPALMARHVTAHDWDNAFINFDQKEWYPGPNYVVMKLWREHFAPTRVESQTADEAALNLVATKTQDGSAVILKAVNLTSEPLEVNTTVDGSFRPASAHMKLIAPSSTQARNSMAAKDNIKPVDAPATVQGNTVKFTLPPYAVAAVRVVK